MRLKATLWVIDPGKTKGIMCVAGGRVVAATGVFSSANLNWKWDFKDMKNTCDTLGIKLYKL